LRWISPFFFSCFIFSAFLRTLVFLRACEAFFPFVASSAARSSFLLAILLRK